MPDCAEHIGLAHLCARRFAGRGVPYDELCQQACAALAQAAANYDPSRGAAFSTYAVPCILGELKRCCERAAPLHVPRTDRALIRQAERLRERHMTEEEREPTVTELARELAVEPEALGAAMEARDRMAAIQPLEGDVQPVDPTGESFVGYLLLLDVIARLPPPMNHLMRLRFLSECTQAAAARRLRMSQARVSRLERQAKELLRKELAEG